MATTQYIGSRYLTVFADPIEWSSTKTYEHLTVVQHNGDSYVSKQFVPTGIDISDTKYWLHWADYNAQIEQYRRETAQAFELAQQVQSDIELLLPKSAFSSTHTVSDEIATKVAEKQVFNPVINLYPTMQIETPTDRVTQGGCIADDSIIFGAYFDNTRINPAYVYDVRLQNGNIINQNTNNTFGHCNDMTYNPKNNTIVIAGADNGSSVWPIYVLNRDSLTVQREITPTVNIWSICYDETKDIYYGIGVNTLYTFNADFEVIKSVEIDTTNYTFQGIACHNGYIFNIDVTTDSIDILDANGNIYKKVPVNYDSAIAEMEFCDFYNDALYIGMASYHEPFMMLYECAITDTNSSVYKQNVNQNVYIDYTTSGLGNGTSNAPLRCISCADVLGLQYAIYYVKGTTKFKHNYYSMGKKKTLIIYGENCHINAGIYLYDCYAELRTCVFENILYARNSSINAISCTFNYNASAAVEGAVTMEYSYCRLRNATFNCTGVPYVALFSTINIDGTAQYAADMQHGGVTNQGNAQPYKELYHTDTAGAFSNVRIPEMKMYRVFILEFVDSNDGAIVECLGFFTPRNQYNQMRFSGTMNPSSANLRNVTGQMNVTNNLDYSIPTNQLHYIKAGQPSDTIYLSRIIGVL